MALESPTVTLTCLLFSSTTTVLINSRSVFLGQRNSSLLYGFNRLDELLCSSGYLKMNIVHAIWPWLTSLHHHIPLCPLSRICRVLILNRYCLGLKQRCQGKNNQYAPALYFPHSVPTLFNHTTAHIFMCAASANLVREVCVVCQSPCVLYISTGPVIMWQIWNSVSTSSPPLLPSSPHAVFPPRAVNGSAVLCCPPA